MKFSRLLPILAVILSNSSVRGADAGKPNVVIMLADDLRPDGLHALGSPKAQTPHLDPLVNQGFIFRRCYTMGSMIGAVCLPSRTMLLTGQSMFRAEKSIARKGGAASGASPDEFTFPRAMKAAGYASLHTGKDGNSPNAITAEFDETYDPGNSAAVADKAVDFIKRKAGPQPLFLYIAGHEPHDPQEATPEFYARYKPEDMPLPIAFAAYQPFDNGEIKVRDEMTLPWPRTRESVAGKLARYCASTSYWDAEMGRIIKALRDAGQYDNTIFIIAGDNGLSLGEHGLLGKQNLYEFGGMHVPLVFSGKGITKGETKAFAYLMDIFPTVCELTGARKPARVEGLSLAPVISGKKEKARDSSYTAYRDCMRAVGDGRWKLIRYPLINKTQLFDLDHDAHEEHDLAALPEHAGKVKDLISKLAELQKQYADPHPLVVPNPQPAEWSPAKLTPKDIEAQQKETAASARLEDGSKKKGKGKAGKGQ